MGKAKDSFFEGKRPWSKIKDHILQEYIEPYLAKVKTLGQPILLIDGYAGPGVFADKTYGSPIIMCEAAEKLVKGSYQAIFINKEKKYYYTLCHEMQERGLLRNVRPLLGDSQVLLQAIPKTFTDQTVFLYLDPFGPTGCKFALLEPFLTRNSTSSTEILLTLSMPGMHRLAARHAVERGYQYDQRIKGFHQTLTNVFGGEYWKDILWRKGISSKERDQELIKAYRGKLTQYFPYVGFCPIQEKTGKRIKYFIVFASHHRDAPVLYNDAMVKACSIGMHQADFVDSLWQDVDWQELRSVKELDQIIINLLVKYSGETRAAIWLKIIEQHFATYLQKEYRTAIQRLVAESLITFVSDTGRLNDASRLYLGQNKLF